MEDTIKNVEEVVETGIVEEPTVGDVVVEDIDCDVVDTSSEDDITNAKIIDDILAGDVGVMGEITTEIISNLLKK